VFWDESIVPSCHDPREGEGELLTYHPDRQGPSSSLDWQEPSFTGRSYGSCQAGDLNAVTTAQRFRQRLVDRHKGWVARQVFEGGARAHDNLGMGRAAERFTKDPLLGREQQGVVPKKLS
jgi:hypothetical protein